MAPHAADPDKACLHEDFNAYVEVNRLTEREGDGEPVGAYSADIRVSCANCGEPFRWIDETVMSAPLRPASSDPDFGLGIPGYAVTMHAGPE